MVISYFEKHAPCNHSLTVKKSNRNMNTSSPVTFTTLFSYGVVADKCQMLLRALVPLFVLALFASCGSDKTRQEDPNNVISKFNSTWNIYEKCEVAADGSIIYKALPWGGLVGTFLEKNSPVDLSAYESVTIDFAVPTPVATQLGVDHKFKTWGKKGITSLTCRFDGQDVTSVSEIVLQASDTCQLEITHVYLTPNATSWESVTVWSGYCSFGNWTGGFLVPASQFTQAYEGDKLEFIFTVDKSDPNVTYWLFKTIFNATDQTLEGNSSELNEWGCASVSGGATVYRIMLTENDVVNLREKGLFVNGYYLNVSQCNLLCRGNAGGDEEYE